MVPELDEVCVTDGVFTHLLSMSLYSCFGIQEGTIGNKALQVSCRPHQVLSSGVVRSAYLFLPGSFMQMLLLDSS